jgi:hypothetical protein
VFGGVGFMSLNADLERDDVAEAQQVLEDLKAGLLKDGLDPTPSPASNRPPSPARPGPCKATARWPTTTGARWGL